MSVGSTHHLEMVFVWKQNYILVDEYFFFCCTWIVNSAHKKQSTKKNLKQYQPVSIDSSVKNAKTLLNAADHSYAVDNNALAAVWKSRGCKEHAEREGRIYTIKGSWAIKKKLIKPGVDGFLNDIPLPRDCGCYMTYIYNLRSLPPSMLTPSAIKSLQK